MTTARTIALALEYHLLKKDRALLRGVIPVRLQSYLRRRARGRYLLWEARNYNAWMEKHLERRRARYDDALEPGLLSVLTPVWDGTPIGYLRALAESLAVQNTSGHCEWVVLRNGCTKPALLQYLDELSRYPWVAVHESVENAGIIGGMRLCLERARHRYVLPVDSDDWLYPDCLRVVNGWIRESGYPPLLYSDEDKLLGTRAVQPYFKPDFDPILLLNSAYIAHLGVIDRELALRLGAYSDKRTEGSPDWDLFLRFLAAGHQAVHIPEVIYSWRMHPESTAEDAGSKSYIHSSQKAVLERYLNLSGLAGKYTVEYSPLLKGSSDWWLERRHEGVWPAELVILTSEGQKPLRKPDYPGMRTTYLARESPLEALLALLPDGDEERLICLQSDEVEIDRADYVWEALGLMERHPETVMVGGLLRGPDGATQSSGYVLGFEGACGCPDRGRPALDPGYFTQLRKQRSVSAVSSQLAVMRASFFKSLLCSGRAAGASLPFLGAWAGAYARRSGKRIAYSPLMSGTSTINWDELTSAAESAVFEEVNRDLLPDRRFYPRYFGLEWQEAYRLVPEE